MDGQTDGWMVRQMDSQTDRWTDSQIDVYIISAHYEHLTISVHTVGCDKENVLREPILRRQHCLMSLKSFGLCPDDFW